MKSTGQKTLFSYRSELGLLYVTRFVLMLGKQNKYCQRRVLMGVELQGFVCVREWVYVSDMWLVYPVTVWTVAIRCSSFSLFPVVVQFCDLNLNCSALSSAQTECRVQSTESRLVWIGGSDGFVGEWKEYFKMSTLFSFFSWTHTFVYAIT